MQAVAVLILSLCLCSCEQPRMAETLNISAPLDEEFFNSKEEKEDGVTFTRIRANKGFLIAKVVQEYNFIWKRLSYRQECEYVDIYKRNDKPFLVALKVVKPDGEENLQFMNTIATWSPVTYNEFKGARSNNNKITFFGQIKKKLRGSFATFATLHVFLITGLHLLYYTM